MENFVEDFIEIYKSEEVVNENKPGVSRSRNREWFKFLEFQNTEEAENYVKKEGIWSKCSKKNTLEGDKTEYRCKYGYYRKNECPARILLLFHSTSCKVSLYATNSEHLHHKTNTRGLNDRTKIVVKDLFLKGVEKPNAILSNLRKLGVPEPSKSKLITFIRQLKIKTDGPPTISGLQLKNWCEDNKSVPETNDTPFVLDYHINFDSINIDEQELIVVVSTVRLLKQLKFSNMVQIDATYKLMWQGYPVIVIGTSDKNKVFHPFAIAICNKESEDEFQFIFSALQKFDVNWKPSVLLADGSTAITSGFIKTFGPPKVRLMCFFHVLENVEKKLQGVKDSSEIKKNITSLQLCNNKQTFEKAAELFVKKWKKTVPDFIHYFSTMWLKLHQNWFEGAASGYPSTNNSIESTYSIIKKEHTLRDRLPVSDFLNKLSDLLIKWSMDRNPEQHNYKIFSVKPSVTFKEWTESYHWALKNKKIMKVNNTYYVCSSSSNYKNITLEVVKEYINMDWETFENFEQSFYGTRAINIDDVNSDISKCNCSCPTYQKNYKCKHILGLLIHFKKIEVPKEVKSIPLGQKRKRGHPSKSKKALIV